MYGPNYAFYGELNNKSLIRVSETHSNLPTIMLFNRLDDEEFSIKTRLGAVTFLACS